LELLWGAPLHFTREQADALAESNPYVHAMHTKSGLLADCADAVAFDVASVEDVLCGEAWNVVEVAPGEHPHVLAGSSVHFDHDWLRVHMPRLAARFSHRYLDVSGIKLECMSQGMAPLPKAEAHRALADIRESVTHLERCRDWQASRVDWAARIAYDRGRDAERARMLGSP
jgi:oligoribonuclease